MNCAKFGASQRRLAMALALTFMLLALATPWAIAEKNYAPGITDTEIKIGQTMPYSGPASAYSTAGKAMLAYFKMLNEQGGVNGRKIVLVSLDDGYSPPKTMEQTRKLVEQEGVAFIYASLGTAANTAIQKYLNERKIPQLLIATSASKFNDPQRFHWTTPQVSASYHTEGKIYAKYILQHKPDARIAVLFQNDDFGKDYLSGLTDGLGDKAAKLIVAQASYEVTDATIDSQIVTLQASGADTFYDVSTPKFAAQAIRKVHDIGWSPTHFLDAVSAYVGLVFEPAGLDKSTGIISATISKDITDPRLREDQGYRDWLAWMQKYYPDGSILDSVNAGSYSSAQALVHILKQCGDDLSRENIMRQATNVHDLSLPMLLPGITVEINPNDYEAVKRMYIRRFNGKSWDLLEEVLAKN
jgi:branched-chain amino acid transport system substrate-binding protein